MSLIPGVWLGKKIILNVNSTGPIDEKTESKLPSFSIDSQIYRLTGQTLPFYRNKFSEQFGVIWQMLANYEYPMNNMPFSVQVNMDHHPLRTRRPKLQYDMRLTQYDMYKKIWSPCTVQPIKKQFVIQHFISWINSIDKHQSDEHQNLQRGIADSLRFLQYNSELLVM